MVIGLLVLLSLCLAQGLGTLNVLVHVHAEVLRVDRILVLDVLIEFSLLVILLERVEHGTLLEHEGGGVEFVVTAQCDGLVEGCHSLVELLEVDIAVAQERLRSGTNEVARGVVFLKIFSRFLVVSLLIEDDSIMMLTR